MTESGKFIVDLQPIGRRIEIPSGTSILDAARTAGAGVISLCSGEGWCGKCLVRIAKGEVAPPHDTEIESIGKDRIKAGYRLACHAIPISDVRVEIPLDSLTTPQRLQVEGTGFEVKVDPVLDLVDLRIPAPGLEDLRADERRVLDCLEESGYGNVRLGVSVLDSLSNKLRELNWFVRLVLHQDVVVAVLPPDSELYGLAVDIGTTKIALYLVNLASGEIVHRSGVMNPQIAYGEDVISRISYVMENEDGRQELQGAVLGVINDKLQEICQLRGIQAEQLVDAVVVGNTAMHHLFVGLPVDQLVFAPYVPAVSSSLDVRARDLDLRIAPGAYVHLLPNIAGYVGADHAAVILSCELWKTNDTVLAIDIGTNTEISLVRGGRISSCSCASGPAFEGAHITHGMRAAPGAIEKMQIKDGQISLFTIDGSPPVGICGSGILDVVAELRKANLINEKGTINDGVPFARLNEAGRKEILLVPAAEDGKGQDITVTRKDINEIQLAKAAIRSGLDILLAEAGISKDDVDRVIVAGAFGTYISIPNAIAIGMFPDIPLERFHQVGNAAGVGAVQALVSKKNRDTIRDTIRQVDYIELTTHKEFQKIFLRAMYLG